MKLCTCGYKGPDEVCPTCQSPTWNRVRTKIASGEMRVESAPQADTDALRPFVEQITDAMGVRALVTDQSTIRDFEGLSKDSTIQWIQTLEASLGVPITLGDRVVDIAARLARKAQALH